MRIGLIAPPWVPVPPIRYGGTEAVIDDLARALVRNGHDVRLFTVEESTCQVPRSWYFSGVAEPMGTTVAEAAHVLAAYEALADADVIHDHTILGPLVAGRLPRLPPIVTTSHGPFTDEARVIYREIAKDAAIVAISHSQRDSAPEVPVAAVIHHGIDLEKYPYGDGAGDYVMFVGRMSSDKGVDRAIRVARAAGRPLVVVSKTREPAERDYFAASVRPLLGDDVRLLDEIPASERIALLRSAVALVNPISWLEPFGLVMAESLACGTPVLAFPNGAAPEIVDDGKTGYLCSDEAAMASALTRVDALDRRMCRYAAESRFDMARMASDYEELYLSLIRSAW
jgi:glycosyltransferase involved in cell wall biosynthesis